MGPPLSISHSLVLVVIVFCLVNGTDIILPIQCSLVTSKGRHFTSQLRRINPLLIGTTNVMKLSFIQAALLTDTLNYPIYQSVFLFVPTNQKATHYNLDLNGSLH